MCARCRNQKAESGAALCVGCKSDLIYQTEIERNAANAQLQAERQAAATKPRTAKRPRTEWKEAV